MSLEAAEREYLKYLQNKVKQSKQTAAAVAEVKQEGVAPAFPSIVATESTAPKRRGRKPKSDEAFAAPTAC
mgnify:CR=1 FL=1